MKIADILKEKREEILEIARRHGAYNVRVFGSVARGEANEDSDVDILVEIERGRTLIDLVALDEELELIFDRKVQVVTDDGISPYLKDSIISEAVAL
jgi:predicted nucleotidyltransferase